jgi:WD40 repeat protein
VGGSITHLAGAGTIVVYSTDAGELGFVETAEPGTIPPQGVDPVVENRVLHPAGEGCEVSALAIRNDGLLAVGYGNGVVAVWDVQRQLQPSTTGSVAGTCSTASTGAGVTSLAWSPAGDVLLAGGTDGRVRRYRWDSATITALEPVLGGHDGERIVLVAYVVEGSFVTVDARGGAQLWSAAESPAQ